LKYIPLNESDKNTLEAWLKKSNELLDELKHEADSKQRSAIIDRNKKHWRDDDLLEFLNSLSGGKCWYTEARFTAEYPQLEHFRPKSHARDENGKMCHDGYWWLAFAIENYRLSKPMPNVKKGTYFPLRERAMEVTAPGVSVTRESPMFLDPINEGDAELISFNALGQPEPCSDPPVDLDDWDRQRIEFSIRRYGLNDAELCDQRKALWVSIDSKLNECATNMLKAKNERCVESAGKVKQQKAELRSYLQPNQEFTSLIIACFQSNKVGRSLYPHLVAA